MWWLLPSQRRRRTIRKESTSTFACIVSSTVPLPSPTLLCVSLAKSAGDDGLHAALFMRCARSLAKPLCVIYRRSLWSILAAYLVWSQHHAALQKRWSVITSRFRLFFSSCTSTCTVNDLPDSIPTLIKHYTDDAKLFRTCAAALQRDIGAISNDIKKTAGLMLIWTAAFQAERVF